MVHKPLHQLQAAAGAGRVQERALVVVRLPQQPRQLRRGQACEVQEVSGAGGLYSSLHYSCAL